MKSEDYVSENREKLEGGLSPEVMEKLKACNTAEEVTALMGECGVELDDETLDMISGGCGGSGCYK